MRFLTSDVASVTDGSLDGPDVEVDGASIDSRSLRSGQLFVPVVDERDGHDFVPAALAAGAAAYLSSRTGQGGTAVLVEHTAHALSALGRAARTRLPDAVVGITGSVGKTSVKDLTAAALGRRLRTTASERSFNNELGVPLTLLSAPDDAEAVVVEMGARGLGHIADLVAVAAPTVGVVTAVAPVHTELFGSIEEVALGKGELVEGLPPDGVAVLNAEDERVRAMADRTTADVLTFGRDLGDVRAERVHLDDELRAHFTVRTPSGGAEVVLPVRGEHNVANACAAVAVALALDVGLEDAVAGLADARLSPWRMELLRTPSGARVLNDAYNANPASVAAALRALAALDAGRRTAVLGVMAELGDHHAVEHANIGALAERLEIRLVAVATPAYGGEQVADLDEALAVLGELQADDAVLVKGSRVAGLEVLAARLAEASGS
jgi:UDP-N-acetylmuramoyl-tripeptide--D-alanyl-D-alanine ligase